ncbi:MAG: sugar ABC transporter permease [Anaerolineae bacterium]|nr:sugar ABC transporter permease [Thermoflexales bacterium]MDW8408593.1 sugar ABC transporter permease [Anaerolineae bacterium]
MASAQSSLAVGGMARRRPFMTQSRREALVAYLFISPWLLGLVLFLIGPIILSFYFSLTKYTLVKAPEWLGFANYERMLTDPFVGIALRVTGTYTLLAVPLGTIASLLIALLLNQKVFGIRVFRTIFYMPSLISGVAVAIVFSWLFSHRLGIVNFILSRLGIQGPNWLGDPNVVLWTLVLMSLWGAGSGAVIFLAALQGVPQSLYEAAELDGAGSFRKFWHITIPLISPVIMFSVITGVIGTFQTFTISYLMTGGGPGYATLFYLLYLYRNAFSWFEMGYASALAWVLFLIILFFTLILLRTSSLWVYYESAGRGR